MQAEFQCKLSQARISYCLNTSKKPEQTWHGYYTYVRHAGKELGGDRNALILEAFCSNSSSNPGIKLHLESVIKYNDGNINEEISESFTLLTKLLGDGRKSTNIGQRPINLKANMIQAYAASATATKQPSSKHKLAPTNSTSRHKPRDGIKLW